MNAPKPDAGQILAVMAQLLKDYFDKPAASNSAAALGTDRNVGTPYQSALPLRVAKADGVVESMRPVLDQVPEVTGDEPRQLNFQMPPELYQKMWWLKENVSRQVFYDHVHGDEAGQYPAVSFQAMMRFGTEKLVDELILKLQRPTN